MLGIKTIRYYYWLMLEFAKKHLRLILLSFLLTFLVIISFISLSPYLATVFFSQKQTIGLVGNYDFNTIPDDITSKISNGLIYVNLKGEIAPLLSTSWEILNSGTQYRFHLRNNLIWSDGSKFTAQQIHYNFKDVEVRVIDEKTMQFTLKKPLPTFPIFLKDPIIKYPLVGVAGLYKVDNIKTKFGYIKELILGPNKKDLPALVYKFFDNETQMINAYKNGEINQFTTSKKSVRDQFATWKNTTITRSIDYTRLMTLFYNFNQEELKAKELRQAIGLAVDQDKFIDFGELAIGPMPPNLWVYDKNLKKSSFDPNVAQKIIKKNISSSSEATLSFTTYFDYLDVADIVNSSLNAAGLRTSLSTVSLDKPNNFDLLLAFWKVPSDPDQYYFWHSTQTQGNIGGYKNVKVDKLLEDGRNTVLPQERKAIYLEFQKIILDDPPGYFLFYPYVYTIKRK